MMHQFRLLALLVCLAFPATGHSRDIDDAGIHPLNPVNQPLVVIRAAKAAAIEELLATRQARAIGLDARDFSGKLPGVDAGVNSLKAFIAALADGNAENLWYCLSPDGGSVLSKQTGAMGWDAADMKPDTALEQLEERLLRMGLDIRDRDVEIRSPGLEKARLIVSRDASARREILEGSGRQTGKWQNTLKSFVAGRRNDTVGVLANTRPLLGVLSLLTGIDFRARLTAFKMSVPVSSQVELFNSNGDLGVELRLNNIIPEGNWPQDNASQVVVSSRPDALLEVNFPAPGLFRQLIDINDNVFFLANINILPLIPRSMNLSFWRNDDGRPAWSLVCLMADKEKFTLQLRRMYAWLDVIRAATSSSVGLVRATAPSGHDVVTLNAGDLSLTVGDADGVGNSAYLILASSPEDWPDPASFRTRAADVPCLVDFRASLDPQTRRDVIATLAAAAREKNIPADQTMLDRMLPDKDSGYAAIDANSLVFLSRSGLMPFLVPALMEMHRPDQTLQKVKKVLW